MSDLLQFEFAAVNQQAEKFQVAHQSSAITPADLVPLLEARRSEAISCGLKPHEAEQVCFAHSDVQRR